MGWMSVEPQNACLKAAGAADFMMRSVEVVSIWNKGHIQDVGENMLRGECMSRGVQRLFSNKMP